MKYLIITPSPKAHKAPKLIEYICSFSEIEGKIPLDSKILVIETKRCLRYIKRYHESLGWSFASKKVRQLIELIDINTLAD